MTGNGFLKVTERICVSGRTMWRRIAWQTALPAALLLAGCHRQACPVRTVYTDEIVTQIPIARPKSTFGNSASAETLSDMPLEPVVTEQAATPPPPIEEVEDVSTTSFESTKIETATAVPVPLDEISILMPTAPDASNWSCPILIHQTDSPIVAIPCELNKTLDDNDAPWMERRESWSCGRIRTVALRKVSGISVGKIWSAPARKGQAYFGGLKAGAYDVYYLAESGTDGVGITASQLPRWPDRRILVEPAPLPPLEDLEATTYAESRAATNESGVSHAAIAAPARKYEQCSFTQIPELGQLLVRVAQQSSSSRERFIRQRHPSAVGAWQLLAKRSTFGASLAFQQIISAEASRTASGETDSSVGNVPLLNTLGCSVQDLLQGSESAVESLRRHKAYLTVASELAEITRKDVRLAECFYGLGKCMDAVSQESKPLIHGAEHLAVVFYMTAHNIDSDAEDALNDLGVLSFRLGWTSEAESLLGAICGPRIFPAAAFNLSQVYVLTGQIDRAEPLLEAAIAADCRCLPAVLASIETQVSMKSPALYADDYRRFANRIVAVATMHAEEPTRLAALDMLERLEVIGREIRLNTASLHQHAVFAHRANAAELGSMALDPPTLSQPYNETASAPSSEPIAIPRAHPLTRAQSLANAPPIDEKETTSHLELTEETSEPLAKPTLVPMDEDVVIIGFEEEQTSSKIRVAPALEVTRP